MALLLETFHFDFHFVSEDPSQCLGVSDQLHESTSFQKRGFLAPTKA